MRILILTLFILVLFSACEKKIEDPLKDLQQKEIHSLNINLYPSNLKMINSKNNPEFEEATKGIKKLHVLQIILDDESKKEAYAEWKSEQDFTNWESIFTARIQNTDIEIKAPEGRDDVLYASADTKEGLFVGFLEGKFDISQVPALMKADFDLGPITDFVQDREKKKEQREKWQKVREEVEKDSSQVDSDSIQE
ncbi:protein of unknown function [Marivirga sericea]|uniref:DUF4252 domain-containing protein n=1 Tax=Marivirga sericea TaxID=1028 RepID=A0A1X7JI07_9BACT|nr:DUF4252 domain-containing protein [Marivirga sericea]SMG27438.1 protein of unknown function [Marivirga sericea]